MNRRLIRELNKSTGIKQEEDGTVKPVRRDALKSGPLSSLYHKGWMKWAEKEYHVPGGIVFSNSAAILY